jgi:hypothetical protein
VRYSILREARVVKTIFRAFSSLPILSETGMIVRTADTPWVRRPRRLLPRNGGLCFRARGA